MRQSNLHQLGVNGARSGGDILAVCRQATSDRRDLVRSWLLEYKTP